MRKRNAKLTILSLLGMLTISTVPIVSHATWNSGDDLNNPVGATTSTTSSVLNPVCYNNSTNIVYHNLKTALDEASSGNYIYMFIGANYTCDESITIKSGVHLVLPFVGKHYDSTKTGTNISNSPMYKLDSADNRNNYGNRLGDDTASNVSTYRSILLNMRGGADITVNGYLHVGGVHTTNGNNGYYSEINLGVGSSITFNSGSHFDCYGYIKENATDYSNPLHNSDNNNEKKINNELDSNRYVELKSGASLTTYIAMYDAQSAGALTTLINANQCPFWEYDFPALQTYTKINSGATLSAFALMVGPNSLTIDKEMSVITNNTSSQAMFYLTSGYLSIEYLTTQPLYSSRGFNARKTNFVIKGALSIGYLYVSEGNSLVSIELDTRNCFLPVNCRMNLYVENSASLTSDKKLKFLAGSNLTIAEGGTFNVNNQVIFHKSDSIVKDTSKGIYYRIESNTTIDDAHLICNGTLTFNTNNTSNGALGAYVEHTSTTGNAVVNMDTLGSEAKLTVSEPEGNSDYTVIVTSSGQFEDEIGQFTTGAPYTSAYANGLYYWVGESVSTYDINVSIASGISGGVVQYTIQTSENANGSNAIDTTLVDATAGGVTSVPRGRYMKIVLTRGQSAVVKDANGNIITSTYTDIVLVNKNLFVTITPNETYTVQMINSLVDGASSNGRGHVDFEIWECKTQNGTYTKVYAAHAIEFTQRVSKDSYFYMVRTFDNSVYNYYKDANAEITKTPSGGSSASNWNLYSTSQSPKYLADANYVFQTYWTYGSSQSTGCLLPSTLITMADGSQKAVQNIEAGDMVRVFNHETGEIDVAPITFNDHDEASLMNVIYLNFSNGKSVGVIYEHGFFDLDTMRYEYITEKNYESFIGHRFYTEEGEEAVLMSAEVRLEYTECYSPTSFYHFDYFVEGMLSMPGGITGLFNIFEFDDDLKYDEEAYNRDIETYGLFTYEDLAPLGVTEIMFEAYAGKYLKVALGKGILTEEYLAYLIERYGGFTEEEP